MLFRKSFQDAISQPKMHIRTPAYRLKLDNNKLNSSYVTIESVLYALSNPATGQIEYIVSKNRLYPLPSLVTNLIVNNKNNHPISMPMTPSPEDNSYETASENLKSVTFSSKVEPKNGINNNSSGMANMNNGMPMMNNKSVYENNNNNKPLSNNPYDPNMYQSNNNLMRYESSRIGGGEFMMASNYTSGPFMGNHLLQQPRQVINNNNNNNLFYSSAANYNPISSQNSFDHMTSYANQSAMTPNMIQMQQNNNGKLKHFDHLYHQKNS